MLVSAAAGFPSIIPSRVLGADAPSNRITVGGIGVGSRGTSDMRGFLYAPGTQILAVCDVDEGHRNRAKKIVDKKYENTDCVTYNNYEELLARDDIDVVFHALPDHWHGIVATAAANAGKDIYGEKPLARTIKEGRAIVNAVERNGVIWQTGSQQRSDQRFRLACELVQNGRIGKILHAESGLPGGRGGETPFPIPVPAGLDWDRWLGPAPAQPCRNFGRGGPHWNWRWMRDFSGGQITDWAGHNIDIAHWGLGLDRTGPVEISATGTFAEKDLFNVITTFDINLKYAGGELIKVSNKYPVGVRFVGEEGWILVTRGYIKASHPSILKNPIASNGVRLYHSRNHHANFLECVRSRRETITPAEGGHRSISAGLLGEIAIYTGRTLKWNPETEEFIGDPVASGLLSRSFREPWVI
jgi:predicted dehydrogenase